MQRKRASVLPLFVFSHGFLRPHSEHEERFSFCSDCRVATRNENKPDSPTVKQNKGTKGKVTNEERTKNTKAVIASRNGNRHTRASVSSLAFSTIQYRFAGSVGESGVKNGNGIVDRTRSLLIFLHNTKNGKLHSGQDRPDVYCKWKDSSQKDRMRKLFLAVAGSVNGEVFESFTQQLGEEQKFKFDVEMVEDGSRYNVTCQGATRQENPTYEVVLTMLELRKDE